MGLTRFLYFGAKDQSLKLNFFNVAFLHAVFSVLIMTPMTLSKMAIIVIIVVIIIMK